jgi:hypothetical protein
MTSPTLHPWLDSPEAVKAAHLAVRVAENKMTKAAIDAGADELFSEALIILTQCALPPRERGHFACVQCGSKLESVRAGAKFCSRACRDKHSNARRGTGDARGTKSTSLPPAPSSYIGAMWSWPEARREEYAVREVGFALCNYLRTRVGRSEVATGLIGDTPSRYRHVRLQGDVFAGNQTVTLEQYHERELARQKARNARAGV